MEPEERKKLNRALELAEENNKILSKLYRGMQLRRIFTVLYWIVIIGVAVGAFYFIQPYFEQFSSIFQRFQGSAEEVRQYFGNNGESSEEREE